MYSVRRYKGMMKAGEGTPSLKANLEEIWNKSTAILNEPDFYKPKCFAKIFENLLHANEASRTLSEQEAQRATYRAHENNVQPFEESARAAIFVYRSVQKIKTW